MVGLILALSVDIKMAQCQIACRYTGYDNGSFREDKCLCIDERDYDSMVQRKIFLVPKKHFNRSDLEKAELLREAKPVDP